ncbi:hypothetical protein INR49_002188 [Caranx melampygus]|nr:hypothetical protein INR49_002188 [Caranx melampygus]
MSSELACLVAMRHLLMWWLPFFFCWLSGPSSSSFCRLYLVLLFWNHTFTWTEERAGLMMATPGGCFSHLFKLKLKWEWVNVNVVVVLVLVLVLVWTHLCFRQTQAVGQLLPLGSHHVVILLEGSLQPEQLGRGEGRPDPLGFPGEGTVEQQTVLGHVVTWSTEEEEEEDEESVSQSDR